MKQLSKFNTEELNVDVINEESVSIIYVSWSKDGIVTSKSIVWVPMDKLSEWLDTPRASTYIKKKIQDVLDAKEALASISIGIFTPEEIQDDTKSYDTNSEAKVFSCLSTKEVVVVRNVSKFCKERGIPYGAFKKMARGRTKTSHGWMLLTQ